LATLQALMHRGPEPVTLSIQLSLICASLPGCKLPEQRNFVHGLVHSTQLSSEPRAVASI
jgi:hypothetical protein